MFHYSLFPFSLLPRTVSLSAFSLSAAQYTLCARKPRVSHRSQQFINNKNSNKLSSECVASSAEWMWWASFICLCCVGLTDYRAHLKFVVAVSSFRRCQKQGACKQQNMIAHLTNTNSATILPQMWKIDIFVVHEHCSSGEYVGRAIWHTRRNKNQKLNRRKRYSHKYWGWKRDALIWNEQKAIQQGPKESRIDEQKWHMWREYMGSNEILSFSTAFFWSSRMLSNQNRATFGFCLLNYNITHWKVKNMWSGYTVQYQINAMVHSMNRHKAHKALEMLSAPVKWANIWTDGMPTMLAITKATLSNLWTTVQHTKLFVCREYCGPCMATV